MYTMVCDFGGGWFPSFGVSIFSVQFLKKKNEKKQRLFFHVSYLV